MTNRFMQNECLPDGNESITFFPDFSTREERSYADSTFDFGAGRARSEGTDADRSDF